MYNHLNVNDCVPKFTLLTKYIVYSPQYLTNLMHKICFTISFISCLYMFRISSGIITPIGLMIPDDTKGCIMQC